MLRGPARFVPQPDRTADTSFRGRTCRRRETITSPRGGEGCAGGRHQARVPPAGDEVPPGPQPGDKEAETRVQGGAEAYEVLSDEQKRRHLRPVRPRGPRGTPGHDFQSMRAEDIFSMFEDIFGGGSAAGGGRAAAGTAGCPAATTWRPRSSSRWRRCSRRRARRRVQTPGRLRDLRRQRGEAGQRAGRLPTCGGHGA
jgi:curved DNA-binding protein CbpA